MKPRIMRINADWIGKSQSKSGGLQSAAQIRRSSAVAIDLLSRCVLQPQHYFERMKPRLSNY